MVLRISRAERPLYLAFALSLVLHAVLLAIRISTPSILLPPAAEQPGPRLDITLAKPTAPREVAPETAPMPAPTQARPPEPTPTPRQAKQPPRRLTVPAGPKTPAMREPAKPDTAAESEAARRFREELYPPPPKPPSGAELAQRALAMASGIAREQSGEEQRKSERTANARDAIDPYSMELYFDAFVRKLNRSAAFVKNERREKGAKVAVVEVSLNADGSLKSYKILTAADQQAEIEYVRQVVEQAAPFAAFPSDIRKRIDSLSIDICILPGRFGADAGMFSRTFDGRDCRELG